MKKLIPFVSGLSFALGVVTASQAQVTLDVSKVSCEQFAGYKITNPRDIAIWLSGYYNGHRGNTMLDPQAMTANAKKLQDFCIRNREVPVMQAIETLQKWGTKTPEIRQVELNDARGKQPSINVSAPPTESHELPAGFSGNS